MLAQLTPGLDNLHLRRRPAVRLQLHRRDHRDPRRRRDPHRAARRAELAAGSDGRRRRHPLRRRRHLLLRRRARRRAADRRACCSAPAIPGFMRGRGRGRARRVRRHHLRRPGRPLPAGAAKPSFWPTVSTSSTASRSDPAGPSWSPSSAPAGCCASRSGSVEVLAVGPGDPVGVAFAATAPCLVAESGAGRVVRLAGRASTPVVDGLQRPQGILVRDGTALRRRRRRQGSHRGRPEHRGAHARSPPGCRSARRRA